MVESRLLKDSTSFDETANEWAAEVGLMDTEGNLTVRFPVIIGVPDGSPDLGTFDIGIIPGNRTIKQAFQVIESDLNTRMFAGNNLSELPNKTTARTNLGLGSAATWNVGTTGAVVPLLNTANTWTARQTFSSGVSSNSVVTVTSGNGQEGNFFLLTGTSNRWAVVSDASAESGANAGSNFYISRFGDDGLWIDTPIGINRATGIVSLSKPLPVASGGTGGTTLAALKTALALNNVENTADANKPISTAVNTALANKFDKTGGNINGNTNVTGNFYTTSFIRAGTTLVCDGNASEGGQLTLGYPNVTGLSGQGNGTWNVDVDNLKNFRIFRQAADGSTTSPPLMINEAGSVTLNFPFAVNANGAAAWFSGAAQYNGIALRNNYGSASLTSNNFIDSYNELGTITSSYYAEHRTNGSSAFSWFATPAGSRSVDRRTNLLWIDTNGANFAVPINGRAYPRKHGGGDINFDWNGQGGQPSYLWGGNDGTNMYVYNPSNFSVAYAANSGLLSNWGFDGFIKRTRDVNVNQYWSRQLCLAGGEALHSPWSAPIEIREVNAVGATQSDAAWAPALCFHWGSRSVSSIKMHADASIRFQVDGTGVAYRPTWHGEVYNTGWFRPTGATGIHWDAYNRGITVADNGANYGNITTYGAGLNTWPGYAIGTWAQFMSNGDTTGIHSHSKGDWLVRFDGNMDAFFPKNITAYSDERLKKNRRPIDNVTGRREGMARAAIMYERDGETRVGFGAQTLELVVPEVVKTSDDLIGTKSVNYSDLVAILAVDNDNLAKKVAVLQTSLTEVLSVVDELKARLTKAGL